MPKNGVTIASKEEYGLSINNSVGLSMCGCTKKN